VIQTYGRHCAVPMFDFMAKVLLIMSSRSILSRTFSSRTGILPKLAVAKVVDVLITRVNLSLLAAIAAVSG